MERGISIIYNLKKMNYNKFHAEESRDESFLL